MSARRKQAAPPQEGPRPFETQYSGAWHGHCKSRESAIQAAIRHCLQDGYRLCVIVGPGGQAARVTYDYKTKRITVQAEDYLHKPAPILRKVRG